jgi:hypothetical protein
MLKLQRDNPELTEVALMKMIALMILNVVEVSAQDAAWYLLRHPMGYGSRDVFYVQTVSLQDRQKCRKRLRQMDEEVLSETTTDVWTKCPIQRYEERPADMTSVCLTEFLVWFTPINTKRWWRVEDVGDDPDSKDDDNYEDVAVASNNNEPRRYKRQLICLVLWFK